MKGNRREFLRKSATTCRRCSCSRYRRSFPRAFLAATKSAAPSDRVRLGFIGVGNQGGHNLEKFLEKQDRVDVVALCDVDHSSSGNSTRASRERVAKEVCNVTETIANCSKARKSMRWSSRRPITGTR